MRNFRFCDPALLYGIILWWIILPIRISGQTTAKIDTTKTYQLKEVVFTGKTINRDVVPAQTLSGKQLERLLGSTDKRLWRNRRIEDRQHPKHGNKSCGCIL